MNLKLVVQFASLVLPLALALGNVHHAFAQTTNGNGGAVDVGTWDEGIFVNCVSGSCATVWDDAGSNYFPLVNWTTISGSNALSGTYEAYNSVSTAAIDQNLALLAAAQVDFLVLDLTNESVATIEDDGDYPTALANANAGEIAKWNANNGIPSGTSAWKFRYAIAVGESAGISSGSGIESAAQAVYNTFVTNATYGGASNYYQIDGQYLLVPTACPNPDLQSVWSSYGGTKTYGDYFYFGWAECQGAGQWGWQIDYPGLTQVDTADSSNVVMEVMPAHDNHLSGWASTTTERNDGLLYQANWNTILNNPPRIVMLIDFNDWWEDTGVVYADTQTVANPPNPLDNPYGNDSLGTASTDGKWPESWTLPDQNITLAGYWNYTVAGIAHLRNSSSPTPAWPQPSPNLAVSATASASSTVNSSWEPSNAIDGNSTTAWSSEDDGSNPNSTEWIQLSWSTAQTFNTVALQSRSGNGATSTLAFPATFAIQYWNGSAWTTLVQENNFPIPTIPGQPIEFTWGSSVTTTEIRIYATQLNPDNFGNYYFQLSEFEVFNNTNTPTMPVLANWGFETPWVYEGGSHSTPSGGGVGWTFSGSSGVQQNGNTTYASPMAPQGKQTGYITGSSSSISQSITLPAGTYTLRFLASETDGESQTIDVSYGGTNIGTFTSFPSTTYAPYVTSSFTSTGAGATISFAGAGSGTALIDEVQIFNKTAITSTTNLLSNPSWSTGDLTDWDVADEINGSVTVNSGGYNGDPYYMKVTSTGSGGMDILQTVTGLAPGTIYTASVWFKTSSTATGAYVAVQDGIGGGHPYSCFFTVPANVTTWTQYLCSSTVDSTGELVYQIGVDGAAGSAEFDNASLVLSSTAAPYNNLLANPSWSTGGLSGWDVADEINGTVTVNSGGYDGDPYFMNVTSTGGGGMDILQTIGSLTPGSLYTAAVWFKTSSTASGGYVAAQDAIGTGTYTCFFTVPANVTSWTQYGCSNTVDGTGEIVYQIGVDGAAGSAEFDNAYFGAQ